jgi:hypothetical protein
MEPHPEIKPNNPTTEDYYFVYLRVKEKQEYLSITNSVICLDTDQPLALWV